MSYNFVIHATCLLTLTTYKYNELQVSFAIQTLSCKVSYKTSFFLIVMVKLNVLKEWLNLVAKFSDLK